MVKTNKFSQKFIITFVAMIAFGEAIVSARGTTPEGAVSPTRKNLSKAHFADPMVSGAGLPDRATAGRYFGIQPKKFIPPQFGGDDDTDGPSGGQAEVAIAVDVTGRNVVIGFNDSTGWDLSPKSVSGFAYSTNGGASFTYGHTLPTRGNKSLNGTYKGEAYPFVHGDPDVKYVPGGNGVQFIYASLMVKGLGTAPNFTGTAQTMCIHRSTDGGRTWQGPFEITPATNPNGNMDGNDAQDFADKEFIDVDPVTGRVIVAWANFISTNYDRGVIEISASFCDDIMSTNGPTWSPRIVLNGGPHGDQGVVPRFAGNGSSNVFAVWERFGTQTESNNIVFGSNNILFTKSTDYGLTWTAPIYLRPTNFYDIDYILGNDRVHQFPSLAVDSTSGTNQGNIYLVYADNDQRDGADIVFQRSTDGGANFSAPVFLNSRPGADRAQWFPYITVDRQNGRVSVIYYDQGIATSGDLMETTWVYSDDGGLTWSKPCPVTTRPYHGGYGNEDSQPNLGDYIGCTAQNGILYCAWAGNPPLVSFVDGQPYYSYSVPDYQFAAVTNATVTLALGEVSFTESGADGFLDPGDIAEFRLPLRNYVTNPILRPTTHGGVSATLSTATPGVMILTPTQWYPFIGPGLTQTNSAAFAVMLLPSFAVGTRIEFTLDVTTSEGMTSLRFSQPTGTPVATTIFSQNFDQVPTGSLPSGWAKVHSGGTNTVPWTTTATVPGAPGGNALFHTNANDGLYGDSTRTESVTSRFIAIPRTSSYVTLDFDIWYDTEDDPDFNIRAYDGATLEIIDQTNGHGSRHSWVEAFAEEIKTGDLYHFPKHLPRSDNENYFQDISVWAGDSGGWQHVHMKLPGMAGTTIQLQWDYTQDASSTATDIRLTHTYAGVAIDNIVMRSVVLVPCALSCAANITLTNEPGQRGAVVNYAPPMTAGACQEVICIPAPGLFFPTGTTTVNCTNAGGQRCSFDVTIHQPPLISSQPQDQAGLCGTNAVFSVTADGTAPLSYQWFLNETNLIMGASESSLLFNVIDCTSIGKISVLVSNAYGTVLSAPANLTLSSAGLVLQSGPNKAVACSASWDFEPPNVFDSCTTNVTLSVLGTQTNGHCPQIITRIWQAIDSCGRNALGMQSVALFCPGCPPIAASRMPGGEVLIAGAGSPGAGYSLWASSDLLLPLSTWLLLMTGNLDSAGVFYYSDWGVATNASRFYRMTVP